MCRLPPTVKAITDQPQGQQNNKGPLQAVSIPDSDVEEPVPCSRGTAKSAPFPQVSLACYGDSPGGTIAGAEAVRLCKLLVGACDVVLRAAEPVDPLLYRHAVVRCRSKSGTGQYVPALRPAPCRVVEPVDLREGKIDRPLRRTVHDPDQ